MADIKVGEVTEKECRKKFTKHSHGDDSSRLPSTDLVSTKTSMVLPTIALCWEPVSISSSSQTSTLKFPSLSSTHTAAENVEPPSQTIYLAPQAIISRLRLCVPQRHDRLTGHITHNTTPRRGKQRT